MAGAPSKAGGAAAGSSRMQERANSGGAGAEKPVNARPSRQSASRVRVRYAETDKMGVVYYANYFVWFEVARADLLRSLGWSYRDMETAGVMLPVTEAECRYHRAAKYDDELEVHAEGRLLSPVRMEFIYRVVGADETVAASGRTIHAAVTSDGRPCRLPARILEVFA